MSRRAGPVLVLTLSLFVREICTMAPAEREQMRQTVEEMFYHAFDGYMERAFPHDELRPISGGYTDALVELGAPAQPTRRGYSGVALTLIDSLDTLAVIGNASEFARGVRWVSENVDFDIDIDVSVFETTIRLLGGLLSAHMLANGTMVDGASHVRVAGYGGELLVLARDLGERLLGAFDGCEALPRAFVNLRDAKAKQASHQRLEQCSAGVGTLLLEFGVLSRLTGDPSFEHAALCALRLLWSKRSKFDLLGNTLDVRTGHWRNPTATIGAGVDSFYEYSLKAYLVFGKPELYAMWNASASAVEQHLRADMHKGHRRAERVEFDALQAFWPALQVLAGELRPAAATFEAFHSLWRKFNALPERFDVDRGKLHDTLAYYPLRPELAESCYALYHATRDARYLQIGAEMVTSLNSAARTFFGFAAIKSVRSMALEDQMPSFFLAETLKYLYLLFDEASFANTHAESYVFTTEGHLIPLSTAFHGPGPAPPTDEQLSAYGVLQLRELIARASLPHGDCIEKGQLRERARLAARRLEAERRSEVEARQAQDPRKLVCRTPASS